MNKYLRPLTLMEIVQGLQRLKKKGIISGLWIDAGQIRITYPADDFTGRRRLIGWKEAEGMVHQYGRS